MKNLIKKVLLLLVSILFFSCSQNEEDATTVETNSQFFNLNVGNTWVYKKYENSSNNPTQFVFSGIVDTVKIVSIETIQGLTFAKKSSKKVNINNGFTQPITYSYVRINNLGHLVQISDINNVSNLTETQGTAVIHPINDYNYVYNRQITSGGAGTAFGNIEFRLYNPENITVEGNNYNVIPYNGIFTPSINRPELVSKTVEVNYAKNIGLIRYLCHSLSGNYEWEERLVSYQIN